MTEIYLIRHAQAMGNKAGKIQGRTDLPLSSLGEQQLEHLALGCRAIAGSSIYASPYIRTKVTAEAANRFLGFSMTVEPELREIDMGLWENLPITEVDARWPAARKTWREQYHLGRAPEGESVAQVYARTVACLTQLAALHQGQGFIAVTHGGVIRNACAWALGGPEKTDGLGFVHNASITRIDVENDLPRLTCYDGIDHLPQTLQTT